MERLLVKEFYYRTGPEQRQVSEGLSEQVYAAGKEGRVKASMASASISRK